jgi:hypothetical protein
VKTILFIALMASFGLAGCGKKASPPPPASARQDAGVVSVESTLNAPPTPAPPPAPGQQISANAPTDLPEQEKSLTELTVALQTYMQVSSNYPKDLNDLVKIKLLKKMPVPPPGKKFAIDRQNIRVILVDN